MKDEGSKPKELATNNGPRTTHHRPLSLPTKKSATSVGPSSPTLKCRGMSNLWDHFPQTVTGKIQKFKIREAVCGELGLSEELTA